MSADMWRAYLIETMTGVKGPEIEMSTNGRWDIRLNMIERATVTVQKSSLAHVDRKRWCTPWRSGVLLTFTTYDGVERPILAGPITAPADEYVDSLSFSVGGIRAVLEHRVLISQGYYWSPDLTTQQHVERLKAGVVSYRSAPLGYIAQDIVRLAMDKRGGQLPIVFPSTPPATVAKGGHDRTYNGFDFQNNMVDDLLGKLSDVTDGPDIMFRPAWGDAEQTRVVWEMLTGNEVQPTIPQQFNMTIDSTSVGTQVSELSLNTSGDHYTTRAWVTGAGEGAGIAAAMREDLSILNDYYPLLESVSSLQNVTEYSTLDAAASAAIDRRPFVEVNPTIDCSDERSPLGLWNVGDKASLVVSGWYSIPDGSHPLRIVRAAGNFDSTHATLYFQEDQW